MRVTYEIVEDWQTGEIEVRTCNGTLVQSGFTSNIAAARFIQELEEQDENG